MTELDPQKTMCVAKHDGAVVGQIPAADADASSYLAALARKYGELAVDYVLDEAAVHTHFAAKKLPFS